MSSSGHRQQALASPAAAYGAAWASQAGCWLPALLPSAVLLDRATLYCRWHRGWSPQAVPHTCCFTSRVYCSLAASTSIPTTWMSRCTLQVAGGVRAGEQGRVGGGEGSHARLVHAEQAQGRKARQGRTIDQKHMNPGSSGQRRSGGMHRGADFMQGGRKGPAPASTPSSQQPAAGGAASPAQRLLVLCDGGLQATLPLQELLNRDGGVVLAIGGLRYKSMRSGTDTWRCDHAVRGAGRQRCAPLPADIPTPTLGPSPSRRCSRAPLISRPASTTPHAQTKAHHMPLPHPVAAHLQLVQGRGILLGNQLVLRGGALQGFRIVLDVVELLG